MKGRLNLNRRDDRGATLVEFALIMPLLLLIIFGIAEFGRFIAIATEVETASRDAARYGSAVGTSVNGVPRYTDCAEIREAARSLALLVALPDSAIDISYDEGPGTGVITTCPVGSSPSEDLFASGDRIVVTVNATFQTQIPIISDLLGPVSLSSTDRRTLFKG